MDLIKTPSVDWIGKRRFFFLFSGALMAASVLSIATRGFNYAIDFTGGTLLQLSYTQEKTLTSLRSDLAQAGYPEAMPQSFAGSNTFSIRIKGREALTAETVETLLKSLQDLSPGNPVRVERKEYVGPTVGRHLKRQAFWAVVLALVGIIVYVAFRFTNPVWGAAGVLALLHDVLATAGLFSLLQREVDLVIVAALLTIAGYSINDTIVIFDRMRERLRLYRREDPAQLVNASINETMSRTLITNGCVISVVAALFFFGGRVIHDFAMAMLFGGFIGTYSTVAIATPLVYEWERRLRPGAPTPAAPGVPAKRGRP